MPKLSEEFDQWRFTKTGNWDTLDKVSAALKAIEDEDVINKEIKEGVISSCANCGNTVRFTNLKAIEDEPMSIITGSIGQQRSFLQEREAMGVRIAELEAENKRLRDTFRKINAMALVDDTYTAEEYIEFLDNIYRMGVAAWQKGEDNA